MRKINTIVIHHSVSPRDLPLEQSVKSFDANHATRLHPEKDSLGYHVAYHYVIAGDGRWKQTRAHDEVGFHAGFMDANQKSIGICLTGNFDEEEPTQAQLDILKNIIDNIKEQFPIMSIIGQRWVPTVVKTCPGNNFTDTMLAELNKNAAQVIVDAPVLSNPDPVPSDFAKEAWDKASAAGTVNGRPHDKITVDEAEILMNRYNLLKTVDGSLTRERMIVALERNNTERQAKPTTGSGTTIPRVI